MARVVRPGGRVGAYVWDYAGKMELIRYFWDAAAACDPAAVELDEGRLLAYAMALPAPHRAALREELRARLAVAADGSISLVARAWAALGRRAAPTAG